MSRLGTPLGVPQKKHFALVRRPHQPQICITSSFTMQAYIRSLSADCNTKAIHEIIVTCLHSLDAENTREIIDTCLHKLESLGEQYEELPAKKTAGSHPMCKHMKDDGTHCHIPPKPNGFCHLHQEEAFFGSPSLPVGRPSMCKHMKDDGTHCEHPPKLEYSGFCGYHKNEARSPSSRSPSSAPFCRGTKTDGTPCRSKTRDPSGFCGHHADQA